MQMQTRLDRYSLANLGSVIVDRSFANAKSGWLYQSAKRGLDVVLASLLLVISLPVVVAAMMAIRVTSPGPVIFAQVRSGHKGKPFVCFKLRTMVNNAERVLEEDTLLRDAFVQCWKLPSDPRVTTVGRFLRKTSIDELPQLFNVLRGEMSIVGPRPVQLTELRDLYGTAASIVTAIKPGLTGLWQVSGRSLMSYDERVALDLSYAETQSFWLDVKVILQTIPAVLMRRGAI